MTIQTEEQILVCRYCGEELKKAKGVNGSYGYQTLIEREERPRNNDGTPGNLFECLNAAGWLTLHHPIEEDV